MVENQGRDEDDDEAKLIPEWGVKADDQIVLGGVAVAVILALVLGWSWWQGDDDEAIASSAVTTAAADGAAEADGDGSDAELIAVPIEDDTSDPAAPSTAADDENDTTQDPSADDATGDDPTDQNGDGTAEGDDADTDALAGDGDEDADAPADDESAGDATSTTAEETTTTAAAALADADVEAVLDPLDGEVTGAIDGDVVTLTGFVATDDESAAAEEAVASIDGVASVDNQLVVLQPAVEEALADAGITDGTATGTGTAFVIGGTAPSDDERTAAEEAVTGIDGIGEVTNEIEVGDGEDDPADEEASEEADEDADDIAAALNDLPQVRFAYNSAVIAEESFADLDEAAALLGEAGDTTFEIQGYTDVLGPAADNRALSQRRADAVRQYLVDAGVSADALTAVGYGETTQFGPSLADNRLVRFEPAG